MSDKWDVQDVDDGTRILASNDKRKIRMNECKQCELLATTLCCTRCNCFMPLKTWIENSKCPLDKW